MHQCCYFYVYTDKKKSLSEPLAPQLVESVLTAKKNTKARSLLFIVSMFWLIHINNVYLLLLKLFVL